MIHKIIGSTGVLFATLLAFTHLTLAQNEPVIHQTLFTNVNVFDSTIENYFSEALGIDAPNQKALRDLYLVRE
jgi:hypothetical protein